MYFPFKPLTTTRHPFFWPLPPTPASWPPSASAIWDLFHRLLQPPRRWACRFKPVPAARRPIPGPYHERRRHRTVSADQLGHISPTPAATAPVGLVLQCATNHLRRHRLSRLLRAFSTTYSSYHAVIVAAEKANSTTTSTAGISTCPL